MSMFWGSAEFYANIHNSNDGEENAELELLVHAYLRDVHYTSRRTAILNVVYATFNVGLVALPLAAERAGLPLFIFGVLLIALCAGYTTSMIIKLAHENRVKTLEDLCEIAFGQKGFVFVCVMQIIFSMSLMCITLDVWADIVRSILATYTPHHPRLHHRYFGLLTGFVVLLPVCLRARSLSSLRWSSYFSVFAILAALVCILAGVICSSDGYHNLQQGDTLVTLVQPKSLGWLLSLVVTFCFSNRQKVFTAYYCLRRRNPERWSFVVRRSHIITAIIYICFGVLGFLSDIKDDRSPKNIDYFLEYDGASQSSKIYFSALSGVVAFSLLLTVPVDCLVAATTCKRLWARYRHKSRLSAKKSASQFSNIADAAADADVDGDNDGDRSPMEREDKDKDILLLEDGGDLQQKLFTTSKELQQQGQQGHDSVNSALTTSTTTMTSRNSLTQNNGTRERTYSSQCTSKESSSKDLNSLVLHNNNGIAATTTRESLNTIMSDKSSITTTTTTTTRNSLTQQQQQQHQEEKQRLLANEENGDNMKTEILAALLSAAATGGDSAEANNRRSPTTGGAASALPRTNTLTNANADINNNTIRNFSRTNTLDHYTNTDLLLSDDNNDLGNDNNNNNDQNDTRVMRQSSLEELMSKPLSLRASCSGDIVPILLLWAIVLGLCASYDNFGTLGIVCGPLAAALLVYIIPSMIYFRLGLNADFQSQPLFACASVVPNAVYMQCVQVLGILLLVGNFAAVLYMYFSDQVLISF